ncbi:hypothetical protein FHL81_24745 [Agrobacterium tumefaciens]|uniref:hypothetical protein n=1 Tax=Agrobacterium tumefaciens TaxID=358 RepID=UPI0011F3F051|nr:hypothetical protein [Agrobacterium tumefaciens]KAA1232693.1 hypothetical protein FHL81_24745 [Agrobacterium tumefaciens]NSY44978.1 hypothetical protein [Agrobacterium tumefaciens]
MTNTFSVAGTTEYKLALDGETCSRFGLQVATEYPVFVVIGENLPAANTPNYLLLSVDGTRELVTSLAETDKVYVRSANAVEVALRGYSEGRT